MELQSQGFDGVFRFTNPTTEDFTVLWNSKEYTFPARSTCPMIIQNETQEAIQEIRKKFAYKLAQREFYNGKIYKQMSNQGRGMPPLFDEKLLQPTVDACLTELPITQAIVKPARKIEQSFRGTKAIGKNANLNVEFKDDEIVEIGRMAS